MWRRAALVGLSLLPLPACATAPPPDPAAVAARAADELDVLDAVFGYQMDHIVALFVRLQGLDSVYLSLAQGSDPSPELLSRFAERSPRVRLVSEAGTDPQLGIRSLTGGDRGIILHLDFVRWVDKDTVDVDGGYYQSDRSASNNTYRAERRDGKWVVLSDTVRGIS